MRIVLIINYYEHANTLALPIFSIIENVNKMCMLRFDGGMYYTGFGHADTMDPDEEYEL